jgi:hypothetical protein
MVCKVPGCLGQRNPGGWVKKVSAPTSITIAVAFISRAEGVPRRGNLASLVLAVPRLINGDSIAADFPGRRSPLEWEFAIHRWVWRTSGGGRWRGGYLRVGDGLNRTTEGKR